MATEDPGDLSLLSVEEKEDLRQKELGRRMEIVKRLVKARVQNTPKNFSVEPEDGYIKETTRMVVKILKDPYPNVLT